MLAKKNERRGEGGRERQEVVSPWPRAVTLWHQRGLNQGLVEPVSIMKELEATGDPDPQL